MMRWCLGAVVALLLPGRRCAQVAFESSDVVLSDSFEAIGPWPIGTREWPIFPGACGSDSIEKVLLTFHSEDPVPCVSALLPGGKISWTRVPSHRGLVHVEYPDVEWDGPRATQGWSALQHQTYLRTNLTVTKDADVWIDLQGAAEFALDHGGELVYYPADVYRYGGRPHHVHLTKGQHVLIVRQVYDVRSHGDPRASNGSVPKSQFRLAIEPAHGHGLQILADRTLVPDRLPDGFLASPLVGLVVRSSTSRRVDVVLAEADGPGTVSLLNTPVAIGPWQTQQLLLGVSTPPDAKDLVVELRYRYDGDEALHSLRVEVSLPDVHKEAGSAFRYTYLTPDRSLGWAMARAPAIRHDCSSVHKDMPVIVALHGAGISADEDFWVDSIDRQQVWTIFAQGRALWSFDWHAIGSQDVSSAVMPVRGLHARLVADLCQPDPMRLIVIGHSNGGQGAWYLASRFPDRVIAAAPAAAYSRITDYVPFDYELSRYVDPSLKSVLMSGLLPYDNIAHVSNAFATPILAQHGSVDDNVPVYHSRRLVEISNEWSPFRLAEYSEVQGANHWWPECFRNGRFQAFIDSLISATPRAETTAPLSFTLTTTMPDETGALYGLHIAEVEVPGKIGRLEVSISPRSEVGIYLSATNVVAIGIDERYAGAEFQIGSARGRLDGNTTLTMSSSREWRASTLPHVSRRMGPIQQMLDGRSPLLVVHGPSAHSAEAAARLVHGIHLHGGPRATAIDSGSVTDPRWLGQLFSHGLILLGGPQDNALTQLAVLRAMQLPVSFPSHGCIRVQDRTYDQAGYGLLFTLPHPFDQGLRAMAIVGTDASGSDRALRAFPYVTGTPIPEWIILSPKATDGFVAGAGWWNRTWGFNLEMSYLAD